jgi:flagellar basal body L-ring protein FlgH
LSSSNWNNQTANSGSANVSYNTNGGSATSGSSSNTASNNVSFDVTE